MVESLELEESFAVPATIATDTATTDDLTVTDQGSATLQLDASFNISESRSSGRNQGRVSVLLHSLVAFPRSPFRRRDNIISQTSVTITYSYSIFI